MFLDLSSDQRCRSDSSKMVPAAAPPPSSAAAAASSVATAAAGRCFTLYVNFRLIGIVVYVVMALNSGEQQQEILGHLITLTITHNI